MENSLPKNWLEISVGEFAYTASGGTPSTTNKDYWDGNIPWINSGKLKDGPIIEPSKFITELALKNSSAKVFPKETVVIALTGATTGKVGILKLETSTNQSVTGIWPNKNYNGEFLFYQLIYLRPVILSRALGSAQPHINKRIVDETLVKFPPFAEQERIVAKLDALFGQLETIKKSLEKVPVLLKKFKQQVLTQAVTGKLTEEWREGKELEDSIKLFDKIFTYKQSWAKNEALKGNSEAKRLLSKIKLKKSLIDPSLPKYWGIFSLFDIAHLVVDCHNKTAPYESEGINLVRTTNIKDGRIVMNGMRYVSEGTYQFWSKRCPPVPGDILFTREAPMGEAAIIPENMRVCLGQRTMLIRVPYKLIENKYILYYLLSAKMAYQITEKAIGTGVKHLRVGDVENLLISIPPLEEQKEIVRRVESLFAKADAIEVQYTTLKEKIEKLPQAILHKAFKGELTQQLDTDGDARELLRAIEQLKNTNTKTKKNKAYATNEKLRMVAEPR